jgi:hypothetical protein
VKLTLEDDDFDLLAAQGGFLVLSEVLPVNPPKRDLYTTNETGLKMDAARWRMTRNPNVFTFAALHIRPKINNLRVTIIALRVSIL